MERDIEQRLVKEVKKTGGLCLKFVSPGYTGVPDRIILAPGGRVAFAELKARGKHERQRQAYVQRAMRELGMTVFPTVDRPERIGEIVAWCREGKL